MPDQIKHRAFIAMPFRPDLGWVREAIRAACREFAIEFVAVDELVQPGEEIVPAIRDQIRRATIGFAVLTDLNPNVMYELGLLHAASKPTVLLADKETVGRLPFDIRTRFVVTFELRPESRLALTRAVVSATGRLLALFDFSARESIAQGVTPEAPPQEFGVQLSIGKFDWERIRDAGARSMGLQGCATRNISAHGTPPGWRLRARCRGGQTLTIYVDLNGDITELDVE